MVSPRSIDTLAHRMNGALQKEYIVIGRKRVSSLTAWAILTFCLGIVIAVAFLASRSGALQGGYAASLPDLSTVHRVIDINGALSVGSSITFSSTVKNVGYAAAAAGSTGRWCLNNSDCLRYDHGSLGETTFAAFNVGTESGMRTSSTWIATAGTHTIYWCADVKDVINEASSTNNCHQRTFTIPVSGPDLTTRHKGITINGTLAAGNSLTFSSTVKNIGVATAASGSYGRWCIDNASCLSSNKGSLGETRFNAFAVGLESGTRTSNTWVATAGEHTVYWCADVKKVIAESSETNNCHENTFVIPRPANSPDLTTLHKEITINGTLTEGSTLTFQGTVKNEGTASAAAGSTGRWCLDRDKLDCSSPAQGLLGETTFAAFNVGTESGVRTSNQWVATKGEHEITWCADVKKVIAESSETNNCRSKNFTVYPANPTAAIHQASKDFSSSFGVWEYRDYDQNPLRYYTSHPECGNDPCWRGTEAFQVIQPKYQSPGNTKGTIRIFKVGRNGATLDISGVVKKVNTTCGDGVAITIRQGFSRTLYRTFLTNVKPQVSFDFRTHVAPNEGNIYFIVSKGPGNNACDTVLFDPRIERYTWGDFPVPVPTYTGGVTVRKTVLPGGKEPGVLLDGFPATSENGVEAYWDNVSAGAHTLTVHGAQKVFYAVCPGKSECQGPLKEGSAISFSHQASINDTLSIYSAKTDNFIAKEEGLHMLELGAGLSGINLLAENLCAMVFETNIKASDEEWPWIQRAAKDWSKSYIKVTIVHNPNALSLPIANTEKDIIDGKGDDNYNLLILKEERIFPDVKEEDIKAGTLGGIARSFGIVSPKEILPLVAAGVDLKLDLDNIGLRLLTNEGLRGPGVSSLTSHEIGHALGLGHIPSPYSIMGTHNFIDLVPLIRGGLTGPTRSDIEAVNGLYPHCAPQGPDPGPKAQISFTFSPNPATYYPKSAAICGGKEESGQWFTNVTIKAHTGVGLQINDVTINYYDILNRKTASKTWNNVQGWGIPPYGEFYTPWYILPLKSPAIGRAEMIVQGIDSNGNAVTASGSVSLPGKHTRNSCSPDPGLTFPTPELFCNCLCSDTCPNPG